MLNMSFTRPHTNAYINLLIQRFEGFNNYILGTELGIKCQIREDPVISHTLYRTFLFLDCYVCII